MNLDNMSLSSLWNNWSPNSDIASNLTHVHTHTNSLLKSGDVFNLSWLTHEE